MASNVEKLTLSFQKKADGDYLRHSSETLSVSTKHAIFRALLTTIGFYGALAGADLLGLEKYAVFAYILTLFTERSIIQHLSTFTFFAGSWYLWLKLPKIAKESEGFALLDLAELREFPIGIDLAEIIWNKIRGFKEEQRQLVVVRRVESALSRLVHTKSTSEVNDMLDTMCEVDRGIADASYRSVKFAVWFIPVAGFLGTVMGISQAISGFAGIVDSKKNISLNAIKPVLSDATFNLGVAFDTTLLALVLSAALVLFMFYVQRQEEVFLSAVDEYCVSEIVNKLYVQDPGAVEILTGLDALADKVVGAVDKMAATIGKDLSGLAQALAERDGKTIAGALKTIETRFTKLMTAREQADRLAQERLDNLMENLSELIAGGREIESFVKGLGEVGSLKTVLKNTEEALALLRQSSADQHDASVAAIEQNRQALEELLPPLQELSTGIKIKIGD